jgi:hypothetical protein
MSTNVENEERTARIALKEKRLWDATRAMHEHEAEKSAVQSKTVRLRALRLAEEARNPPVGKPKRRAKKAS